MQGFYELIKRIEPANILCYGDPFDEMQGNVITIDYSQTNNLTKWFKETGKPAQKVTTPTKLSLLKGGGGGSSSGGSTSLSTRGKPNGRSSLYRNGKLIQERYYDENGLAEKDIDYTNHGNPEKHPTVPHEHKWDWTDPLKPIRR